MTSQPMRVMKKFLDRSATSTMKRELLAVHTRMLDVVVNYRTMTGRLGPLPHFVIIGTQKGGTTYLYDELVKHPEIAPSFTKEVHFFDSNYAKGLDWYRGFFAAQLQMAGQKTGSRVVTGEASPSYMYHPHALKRILAAMPNSKFIMLLRNPVSRAYSHYHHELRLGFERLSFEEAIRREDERLDGEHDRLLESESYNSHNYVHYSYLRRGIYLDQVKAWKEACGEDQLLILKSEDFYRNTPSVMEKVVKFLELSPWAWSTMSKHEAKSYAGIDPRMKAQLAEFFAPHNRRLYDYLGVDFGWEA
jgi:hypothetical protein